MAAIARSAVLAVSLACLVQASAHDDVLEVVTNMATGLTTVNIPLFMSAFDKEMPGYDTLESNVKGLTNQAEVTSSIEPIEEKGDDSTYSVELDWYLQVRSLLPDGPIVTRRQLIHCELRKEKKHWKVVAVKPIEFFAPAKLDK